MNSCNCEAGVVASPAPYNRATNCQNPPTQLTTVVIPVSDGGDGEHDPYAPKLGAWQNKIVVYQKTGSVYLYDVNGVYTNLTGESLAQVIDQLQQQLDALSTTVMGVQVSVATETSNRQAAVAELHASIQALQAALASEASSREAEDTSLAQQIANLSATSGDVGTALTAETQAREQADRALQTAVSELQTAVAGKQDTLVSGTNLKTVNGMSLLGEGNVDISGGEGGGGGARVEFYASNWTNPGPAVTNLPRSWASHAFGFTTPPAVYVNIVWDASDVEAGHCDGVQVIPYNITKTGCDLRFVWPEGAPTLYQQASIHTMLVATS